MKQIITILLCSLAFVGCKSNKKTQEETASTTKQLVETTETEDMRAPVLEEPKEATAEDIKKYKPKTPEGTYFQIKKTPCFGECPVYTVTINIDGFATMYGHKNFDYLGNYQTQFSEDQLMQIEALADKYNYWNLQHVYDAPVTDLPSTTTTLILDEKSQWVYNRMNSPDNLRMFEQEIETLIKDVQWYDFKPEHDTHD